ncbi:hypothetical protein [Sphingomonas oryzagri]
MRSDVPDSAGMTHDPCAAAEAEAALALGRLDGMLSQSLPATRRIFAGMTVRAALASALTQEGYAFTEPRFDAWFAGLVPLVDAGERRPERAPTMPARLLADAILTELGHNSWKPLADAAHALRPALLAPNDYAAGPAQGDAHACLSEARGLVDALGARTSPLPFASLRRLHAAIAESTRFAPAERAAVTLSMGTIRFAVERRPPPSPRWAIELVYGGHLHATGLLTAALPCPGLVRLDALGEASDEADEPGAARIIRARALRDLALELIIKLRYASESAARIAERLAGLRRSSRAPALAELLTGFGAMRSRQIEAALGATRLGVRGMLKALHEAGLVTRTSIVGTWLTSSTPSDTGPVPRVEPAESPAFSREALADYDAANADIDRLLARMAIDSGGQED